MKKTRQLSEQPLRQCISKDGDYGQSTKKIFRHKQRITMLGKHMKTIPREQYVKSKEGKAIKLEQDFMGKK